MRNESLRAELIEMRSEDMRVRQELVDSGELGGSYVPRMEAVHNKNAERLQELIHLHGWPDRKTAGHDGAEAAWLIVQHAIGHTSLQRACLNFMRQSAMDGNIPLWHAAYLAEPVSFASSREAGERCLRL